MLAPDDTTRGWPPELLKRIRFSYEFDRAMLSTVQYAIAAVLPPSYGVKAATALASIAKGLTRSAARPMTVEEARERLGGEEAGLALREIDDLCPPYVRFPWPHPPRPRWWNALRHPYPEPGPEPWGRWGDGEGPQPDPWRAAYADVVSVRAIAVVAALPVVAALIVDEQAKREVGQIVAELQEQIG